MDASDPIGDLATDDVSISDLGSTIDHCLRSMI